MRREMRYSLIAVAVLVACGSEVCAQEVLPVAPVPVVPSAPAGNGAYLQQPTGPSTSPIPPPPPPPPSTVGQGAPLQLAPLPPYSPAPYPAYPDVPPPPPPFAPVSPWIDRPHGQDCGWFGSFELDIVGSHITNNISNFVSAGGGPGDFVQLPTNNLDWTGSPRFELGYRLPDGWGQFSVAYRLLDTVGHATLSGFDLDGSDGYLKTQLDTNILDFDYGSREYHPTSQTDLQWRLGLRIATVHFDSDAEGYYLQQQVSNNFWGVGPHALIDWHQQLGASNLAFFGRLESAVLFGDVHQSFEELFVAPDGSYIGGATDVSNSQAAPMLDFQVGLTWTPRWRWANWRWTMGYVWERWWNIGTAGGSSADLTTQGIFFRGEFNF